MLTRDTRRSLGVPLPLRRRNVVAHAVHLELRRDAEGQMALLSRPSELPHPFATMRSVPIEPEAREQSIRSSMLSFGRCRAGAC